MVIPAAESPRFERLDQVVGFLACPVCQETIERDGASLRCPRGHLFDIARQGYVSLIDGRSRANTADTAKMVSARDRFLGGDHYAPIAGALSGSLPTVDGLVVDIAGGTGYYLGAVLDTMPAAVGLCLDLSSSALRRAARAHSRSSAIAADAWARLPLRDGVASVALSVFGPRNGSEIGRVLRDDGVLAVVSPTERHLAELIEPLGMISVGADKGARLDRALPDFDRRSTVSCEYTTDLDHTAVTDLVLMGPSAHHIDRDELAARIDRLTDPTTVTVSVEVSMHRPVPRSDRGSHNEST